MKITEIFYSLQGEGFLAGRPSVFVRIAGCPLRCRYCDTKYAWSNQNSPEITIDQIAESVKKHNCPSVVITGGEPMTNPQLPQLIDKLKETSSHITIETAGIKFVPDLPCDLMSISPKLANSAPQQVEAAQMHNQNCLNINALQQLTENYNYQMKFVVDAPEDIEDIQHLLAQLPVIDKQKVMLMPQAEARDQYIEKSGMVAQLCKQNQFTFCQRLHILLYDRQKGI